MIRLGEKQTLEIVKKVDFGVYLAEKAGEPEQVLLPVRQVPEHAQTGDLIEVFVYRDSADRPIATTHEPRLVLGGLAELEVVQTNRVGAFLDWGLEKDLLLPYKEQKKRVREGERVLVTLYLDKSDRLCATMNVYKALRADSPYHAEDRVKGRVYEISDNFGAFVAVDNRYSALIPKRELYGRVNVGDDIEARVTKVLGDGRLNLSIREKAYVQIEKDGDLLLRILADCGGVLPFTEKSDPELIRRETGMSKNEFKRAVGHLLKIGAIEIDGKTIKRIQ